MKHTSIIIFFLSSLFAQYEIEGRWHLVGYEENVMYQFEDNYRYSIYSTDGNFGGLEDAGNSPNPYTIVENIITIDLFFGTIVTYQMNYLCDGQVVEFIDNSIIHSTLFREGYNYIDNECDDYLEEDCCAAEEYANDSCQGLGCYIPQCTIDCEWEPMQCWSSTGYCWCVDENGIEIEDTSTPSWQGYPDCEEYSEELGDFNFDGNINVVDVIILVNHILSPAAVVLENSDINDDGSTNIIDVVILVDIILNNE